MVFAERDVCYAELDSTRNILALSEALYEERGVQLIAADNMYEAEKKKTSLNEEKAKTTDDKNKAETKQLKKQRNRARIAAVGAAVMVVLLVISK